MKQYRSICILFTLLIVVLVPLQPIVAQAPDQPEETDARRQVFLPFVTGPNASQSETGSLPYPPSNLIKEFKWDFSNSIRQAPGSDLWPSTWGADGNIYTSWGDGGGFGGTDQDGRVSLGFARIDGSPQDFKGVNIWGGKNATSPAKFEGKSAGIVSINSILYAWIGTDTGRKLGWSTDKGKTWERSSWEFSKETFVPFTILNFGQDYSGARDGYVYSYGHEWGGSKNAYLIRVPKEKIKERGSYEFFAGMKSSSGPRWTTDINGRKPVFSDSTGKDTNMTPTVVYNPGLQRYLLTMTRGGPQKLGIFDASEPWGPWTTAAYYDNWGGFKGAEGLIYSFPTKWMSGDGKTMWMIFSGADSLDAFNLIKATVKLR